jgi:hypothetical protein
MPRTYLIDQLGRQRTLRSLRLTYASLHLLRHRRPSALLELRAYLHLLLVRFADHVQLLSVEIDGV